MRTSDINKAVVLARGLGTRMRAPAPTVAAAPTTLSPEQTKAADAGMKAMIPVGRPFLDFVLSGLADAGFTEACLVIGPEHRAVREHYSSLPMRRLRVSFAIQEHPVGTANAVLAAAHFVDGDSFLVLNSDNYYPVPVLRMLRTLHEPGLPAFARDALVREGNIPPERILRYAQLNIDVNGYLQTIVEKPASLEFHGGSATEPLISMNCWRFDTAIFRACREVRESERGEFELPQAVQYGITSLGMRFKAVTVHAGVLDLSYRTDIAEVAQRLSGVRVDL